MQLETFPNCISDSCTLLIEVGFEEIRKYRLDAEEARGFHLFQQAPMNGLIDGFVKFFKGKMVQSLLGLQLFNIIWDTWLKNEAGERCQAQQKLLGIR